MQAASKFQVIDQHGRAVTLTDDGTPVFNMAKHLVGKAHFPTEAVAQEVLIATQAAYPELVLQVKELDGDRTAQQQQSQQQQAENPKASATGSERDVRTANRPPRGSSVYEEATDKPAEQSSGNIERGTGSPVDLDATSSSPGPDSGAGQGLSE